MKNIFARTIVLFLMMLSAGQAQAQDWIRLSTNNGDAINEKGVQPPADKLNPANYFWENVFDICDMIIQKMREGGRNGSCLMKYDSLIQGQRYFLVEESYRVPAQTEEFYYEDNWVTESETVTQNKPRYEAEFGGDYERCRGCALSSFIGNRICDRGNDYCRHPVPVSVVKETRVNRPVRQTRMVTTDAYAYSKACFIFNRDAGFQPSDCGLPDPRGLGQYIAPFLKTVR